MFVICGSLQTLFNVKKVADKRWSAYRLGLTQLITNYCVNINVANVWKKTIVT